MLLCEAAADDVTQEVFLQVIQNLNRFRGDSAFKTWLYQISLNAARQHLRRRPRRSSAEFDPSAVQAPHATGPESGVLREELSHEIELALAKLSTRMRSAIVLTMLEHLTPAEAAKVEGCSIATMHWRVHHARKELKYYLRGYVKS